MKVVAPVTLTTSNTESGIELSPVKNWCLWSEEIDGGVWTTENVTVTSGQADGPNGTANSNRVELDSDAAGWIRQTFASKVSGNWIFVAKLKADEYSAVKIELTGTGLSGDTSVVAILGTNTVYGYGFPLTYGSVQYSDEWYWVWVAVYNDSTNDIVVTISTVDDYIADGGFYISHCQLNSGSTVQEYVLTEGAADETDPTLDVWASGSTYSIGNEVYYSLKTYTSLKDANTNKQPDTNSTGEDPWWLETGYVNAWKMFDPYMTTQTEGTPVTDEEASIISASIVQSGVNCVSLLSCVGATATVEVVGEVDGQNQIIWAETKSLIQWTEEIKDWWEFYFGDEGISVGGMVFYFGFETSSHRINIRIVGYGSEALCGKVDAGKARSIGYTLYSPQVRLVDFSKYLTDSFGQTYISKGKNARLVSAEVLISSGMVDASNKIIADRLGTTSVFDFNENQPNYSSLIVYGYPSDSNCILHGMDHNIYRLDIQGLT